MKKLILAAVAAVALMAPAHADDTMIYRKAGITLELKKGSFASDDSRAQQLLTVINRSAVVVKYISIECGFFHDDLLIGSDREHVMDLQPEQSGYVKSDTYVINANRTDCRISGANQ